MPNIGAGTIQSGISLQEIMVLATMFTFILGVLPVLSNPDGINPLDFPPAMWGSLNYLWFDSFKFIGSDSSSCVASLGGIKHLKFAENQTITGLPDEPANPLVATNESVGDSWDFFGVSFPVISFSLDDAYAGVTEQIEAGLVRSFGVMFPMFNVLVDLLNYIGSVFWSCGVGALRFVIGVSIVSYWIFKIINVFGGVSGIVNILSKIF
ncbi:hypothetical protein DRQ25_11550 [Candidatus Fermentibacteria bacterium]|nr:MAG: hypothetical protein DRQ25_11550 [Candidatus Fermentibacteria bacterium]